MKKLLFIMTFMVALVAVNAQVTHTPVKVADLPKAITDNVTKNYVGFTIKDATKVTENNVITYDVKITKGTTNETLVFDKDGKFLRKMPQPAASSTGTPPKK
jgi:hypothetical protein